MMKGFVVGCLLVIILLLVGGEVLFYAAGCAGPSDTIVQKSTSPDGKHTAVLIERGDAASDYPSFVVLCEGSGGCTPDDKNEIAVDKNQGISEINWQSNDKLLIHYTEFTTFTNRKFAQDGVTIEYIPKEK